MVAGRWRRSYRAIFSDPEQTDELISSEGIKNLHSSGMLARNPLEDLIRAEMRLHRDFVRSHDQHRFVNLCIFMSINYKIR